MPANTFLSYNGKLKKANEPVLSADNRSFRYGDGFFETMKYVNGKIILEDLHFERLFASLQLMRFTKPVHFTRGYLREQVMQLVEKNQHHKMARIRITVFRGDGGLYDVNDHFPHHLIQTWDLNPAVNSFNENGLAVGIFKDGRKICDAFSQVKSNNYLPYTMAALWAKEQKLNDALVLNPHGRIADATIANVFIVTNGIVKTPALTEGCVNGVMRRYIIESLQKENISVQETSVSIEDIMSAAEVFLSNAIYGIKWVRQVDESMYENKMSSFLYRKIITPLVNF